MTGNQPMTTTANMPSKRLKILDPDGDSTMQSSMEVADIDDMSSSQPSNEADPSTPRAASYAMGATLELSPPNSQGPSNQIRSGNPAAAASGSPSLNVNGKRILTGASANAAVDTPPAQVHTDPETGYRWSKVENQPGFEWKSARAREEQARALDAISDKGYMIKSMSLL
jgi:hypothetical protein